MSCNSWWEITGLMRRLAKVLDYTTAFSLTETPTPLEGSGTKKEKKDPSFEFRKIIHPPCNLMHDDNNNIKHLESSKTKNNQFSAPQPCKYHPVPFLRVVISDSSYLNSQPLSHRGLINHIQMWHLPPANVPGLPQALGQKSCLNCWNGTGQAEGRVGFSLVAWPDTRRSPMSHIARSRRAHTHTAALLTLLGTFFFLHKISQLFLDF